MGFGIALIGFGFSLYLTYRELFSIHAICEWCVGSAVCMTVLAVLTGDPLPAWRAGRASHLELPAAGRRRPAFTPSSLALLRHVTNPRTQVAMLVSCIFPLAARAPSPART